MELRKHSRHHDRDGVQTPRRRLGPYEARLLRLSRVQDVHVTRDDDRELRTRANWRLHGNRQVESVEDYTQSVAKWPRLPEVLEQSSTSFFYNLTWYNYCN